MSTGDNRESASRAQRVFLGKWLREALPELRRAAGCYLRAVGCSERGRYQSGVCEPTELVNAAVTLFLSGDKPYPLDEDAPPEQVVAVLCRTMQWLAVDRVRHPAVRRRADADGLEDREAEQATPSQKCANVERLDWLGEVFADDEEASAVLAASAEGWNRAEIAEWLGCGVRRVESVQRRIKNCLRSLGETINDQGEAEPPSSSPRGRDDGTSESAGGRLGPPGEHPRVVGGGRRPGGAER